MSTRTSTVFYGLLIGVSCLVMGMVLASRLDLAPQSFAALSVPETNSAPITGPLDATTFRTVAEAASPSVVTIMTTRELEQRRGIADLFNLPGVPNPFGQGQGPQDQGPQVEQGAGSGFVIDAEGYILTNNHVVADATRIEVVLANLDGRPGLPATVVGRDELTDSALIKLDRMPEEPLVPAHFGDSEQIGPGDWVMAIGSPFGLSHTVTVGVVSAVGRSQPTSVSGRYHEMIQTDAAINQGNSGGPLLNLRGEVVGINTMIFTDRNPITGSATGNIGIGFAVPINTVRDIIDQLREGRVVRGRIGVSIAPAALTDADAEDLGLSEPGGAIVRLVESGGPADQAGLEVGDVVTAFNGQPVDSSDSLVGLVTSTRPGSTVPMTIVRDRRQQTLNITVGELDLNAEREQQTASREPRSPSQPTATALGMSIQNLTPAMAQQLDLQGNQRGVVIASVTPAGPAERSGLQPGDVIIRINGAEVGSVDETVAALEGIGPGRTARVVVLREGQAILHQVRP